jgi:P27 family predicted phage terminase small subunit
MAGRKPLPTAIKQLRGNPGRRPLNEAEPKFKGGGKRVPRGHLPEEGKKFWRKYAPVLRIAGVLTEADEPVFEMMSIHYALAIEAAKRIEAEGLTVLDVKTHTERKHPLHQVWRDNSTALKAYAVEFGMTASSRSKVKAEKDDEQLSSLADILFEAAATDAGEQ